MINNLVPNLEDQKSDFLKSGFFLALGRQGLLIWINAVDQPSLEYQTKSLFNDVNQPFDN